MDKRIFSLGIALLVAGIVVRLYLNSAYPVGRSGMSEQETLLLLQNQATNHALSELFSIIAAIGFFILLISFGLKRKKGDAGKITIQKPPET